MSLSAALFDMSDPIPEDDFHPFRSPTRLAHKNNGDEFAHQPGFHTIDFNAVFDDCNPAIKALLIDQSSDQSTLTSRPVPIGALDVPTSIHGDATSLASEACSSLATPLFTPISELLSLPDVIQPEIKALSFNASLDNSTSTLASAPFIPAHAPLSTSGGATLDASNAYSEPPSPLFTPVLGTVDPPEFLYTVQTKLADHLPVDKVGRVETARQDASVCHAPAASLLSGLLPVRAADIDILSRLAPSFNAKTPGTTSQSVKVTDDATTLTSFELSPIPGSQLVNITRKRKRSLIAKDDILEKSPLVAEKVPFPSIQHDAIDTSAKVDAVPPNRCQTSVPLKLLDQIAARAVAATIRASPGTNVFATKPYTKQARKAKASQNKFSRQTSFAFNAPSTSSYTTSPAMSMAQNTGMQENAFPAQWHSAGTPAAPTPMFPARFPQTNVYAQQVYVSNGMPQAANACSSSSFAPPGFHAPSASMSGNLRQMKGQTINAQPMVGQMAGNYPQQAFAASGNFRARPFSVPRNPSAVPPFNNQAFMNAQAANMRRMLGLLYPQGTVARQVQQPATSDNQYGLMFSNTQPRSHIPMQQAVLPSMMPMPSGNPSMVCENWMDYSSLSPQYQETEAQNCGKYSSLPMEPSLANQSTPSFLPTQKTCPSPHLQVPIGSPLSESAFADDAPISMEDATNRPSKRRKQSRLTFPDSDEPVEVLRPIGIRETFRCRIDGCNKDISILRNGAWSVKMALQEHSHIPESPSDEVIVCQWVDAKGQRCLQQTKWANYTRHFSGHLGILVRECEFCGSLQARPSNLTRHYKSCKIFHQQDRRTQEDAWSKLNTRQDFSECEKAMEQKMRNAEIRRTRRRKN